MSDEATEPTSYEAGFYGPGEYWVMCWTGTYRECEAYVKGASAYCDLPDYYQIIPVDAPALESRS